MSKKHKKLSTILNCIEHFIILGSTIPRCISIFSFASLIGISIAITSSLIGLNICAITAEIEKYKSIIQKKKHDKIVLPAKSKLNRIEILISKALTESNISHDEFVVINNMLKEYEKNERRN